MWPRPRLVDLITAHLDTPLIRSGPGALNNTSLSDGGKRSERNQSKEQKKKHNTKLIKTNLESNGAVGGMCVF